VAEEKMPMSERAAGLQDDGMACRLNNRED
jgi:hypothetical protein